jgi:hypothetical protein
MFRTTTSVVLLLALSGRSVEAQLPDTARRVLELHAIIERLGPEFGPRIWPGFRPDTIPTLYVIAHRGKLLVQWRHELPDGFTPYPGRPDAGIAGTEMVSLPSGKFISFMSVDSSMSPALMLGTSIHEAFHSFEGVSRREGKRFGSRENAMLVGTYPVFDVVNETAVALEGRALRRALTISIAEVRQSAREFLGHRERRFATLDPELVQFEREAELNEGLAQYALIRGLEEVGRLEGGAWPERAKAQAAIESRLLDSLLGMGGRSVRRRYYATGSAIALILDRLAEANWKTTLESEDLTLDETLARIVDYQGVASLGAGWKTEADGSLQSLRIEVEREVARLRTSRKALADSLLARPGIRVTIDQSQLAGDRLQWCGFDPQNTHRTGDHRTLHMRFLRVCGAAATIEFDQPVIQSDESGMLQTVVDEATLTVLSGPRRVALTEASLDLADLRLQAGGLKVEAPRATLLRNGRELRIVLRRPEG